MLEVRDTVATGGMEVGNRGSDLPIPPLEMRELVGPTDIASFDNPTGELIYSFLPEVAYSSVFDFGCGCGRVARQLIQQEIRPHRYVGIDLHAGMIEWAKRNLETRVGGFEFFHHDVTDVRFNPSGSVPFAPFPVGDQSFTLVHALSVFTHLTEYQAGFYLGEVARTLSAEGWFLGSWFLFDKQYFPMMPAFANALYVDYVHPGAAVLYAREWVESTAAANGLVITQIIPPQIRGHQWLLVMRPKGVEAALATWPPDDGPIGKAVPPRGRSDAYNVH